MFLFFIYPFGLMPYSIALTVWIIATLLVSLFCGKRVTESSNGYRAMKVSVLDNPRIDLRQDWLDAYQLEVYLLIKLLRLGYRTTEVPVSKIYPVRTAGNTKMRPLVDWCHMLAPIFVVGLGIERLVHAAAAILPGHGDCASRS